MCRIFLSYAREDSPEVLRLYEALGNAGFEPWMDQKNLLPGQDWEREIRLAIRNADLFIACLSSNGLGRRGTFHKELHIALEIAKEFPEGKAYFIPLRLDTCDVPSSLQHIHWLDFFETAALQTLIQSLLIYCGKGVSPAALPAATLGPNLPPQSRDRSVYYKERAREQIRDWGEKAMEGEWNWHNLGNALEDNIDAIRYDPEHQHPWTNLAYVYYLIGERKLATSCLARSYSLASPGPNHPGQNYKNVKRAIDNNLSLSGYTITRDEMPEWFKNKYPHLLSPGPGVETTYQVIYEFLKRFASYDENDKAI